MFMTCRLASPPHELQYSDGFFVTPFMGEMTSTAMDEVSDHLYFKLSAETVLVENRFDDKRTWFSDTSVQSLWAVA